MDNSGGDVPMPANKQQELPVESDKEKTVRRPYEKPRIVYREPVEAMATTCSAPGSKTGVGNCEVVGS